MVDGGSELFSGELRMDGETFQKGHKNLESALLAPSTLQMQFTTPKNTGKFPLV